MNWQEVCQDPTLQDLPYKIELNEWGQIVMSPASNLHGTFQVIIGGFLIFQLKSGKPITECSIDTSKGVKVADVAWRSDKFLAQHSHKTPYPQAPEICIEILSPSNSMAEMQEKMSLYFDKGAQEVWLCDEDGNMSFYAQEGQLENSRLAPGFPQKIEI